MAWKQTTGVLTVGQLPGGLAGKLHAHDSLQQRVGGLVAKIPSSGSPGSQGGLAPQFPHL